MDPLLMLSPHLDDAVLSCGQMISDRPETVVATAFTAVPKRGRMLTPFDKNSGFHSADHALRTRRVEDERALGALNARGVHLGLLDNQYDPAKDWDRAVFELAQAFKEQIDKIEPITIVGPVGIAHPDHIVSAGAFRIVVTERPEIDAWLYEELPSRVLWPEETQGRLDTWREFFPEMALGFLGRGDRAAKVAAVESYRSQLWALDAPTYLVPERFWRLRPCSD
jgi:LmbE family N-acetylglucosaminyl deacetylase